MIRDWRDHQVLDVPDTCRMASSSTRQPAGQWKYTTSACDWAADPALRLNDASATRPQFGHFSEIVVMVIGTFPAEQSGRYLPVPTVITSPRSRTLVASRSSRDDAQASRTSMSNDGDTFRADDSRQSGQHKGGGESTGLSPDAASSTFSRRTRATSPTTTSST